MKKAWLFFISVIIIFVIERTAPFLISFPITIFPAFVVFILLASRDYGPDLIKLIFTALLFDCFSGLAFGIHVLATVGTGAVIFMVRGRLKDQREHFFIGLTAALAFIGIYFGILSTVIAFRYSFFELAEIFTESLIIYCLLFWIERKLKLEPVKHGFR